MKLILPSALNKLGKDRLILLLLFGLLLLVIVVPVGTVDRTLNGKSPSKNGLNTQEGMIKQGKGENTAVKTTDYMESTRYAKQVAGQLEDILKYVEGAGKVKVLVTVRNSARRIVEKDNPNVRNNVYESDSEGGSRTTMELQNEIATVYTADENGNQVPFVIQETGPDIEGVVIVAQGGGNDRVKVHITEAIEALFGIAPHKIKVVKMKGEK